MQGPYTSQAREGERELGVRVVAEFNCTQAQEAIKKSAVRSTRAVGGGGAYPLEVGARATSSGAVSALHSNSPGCSNRAIDLEQFHDKSELDVNRYQLNKLTRCKSRPDDVTAALAWHDLTNMRFDAGKVIEARHKDIQYIKDKKALPQDQQKRGPGQRVEGHTDQVDRHQQGR